MIKKIHISVVFIIISLWFTRPLLCFFIPPPVAIDHYLLKEFEINQKIERDQEIIRLMKEYLFAAADELEIGKIRGVRGLNVVSFWQKQLALTFDDADRAADLFIMTHNRILAEYPDLPGHVRLRLIAFDIAVPETEGFNEFAEAEKPADAKGETVSDPDTFMAFPSILPILLLRAFIVSH